MKLTQEQVNIFSEGKIDGNKFYLQGKLDRKQYIYINEVLENIGLKWNRKEKAHIFDGDMLEDAIYDIIESGECETLKETIKKFQFYPTPSEVADYLVDLSCIKLGNSILEPSAGNGDILKAIIKATSNSPRFDITSVELDNTKGEILAQLCDKMYIQDFLTFSEGKYDRIIMNPPFSKSQDVKHILHAYSLLSECGILVSVASSSIQHRDGVIYEKLKELDPEFIELPEGSFKESGTMVNTVIVRLKK